MNKRVFRDIGRYLALFILTVVALGMYVGFISGTDSAKTTFEKYLRDNNVEDGYVTLEGKIDNRIKKDVESLGIKFYNNYSFKYTKKYSDTEKKKNLEKWSRLLYVCQQ